jgi:hypothetical protein
MRVPKRNAGLITKALRLGIFKLGPKHWADVHRERKNGVFDPEVGRKGGRKGGASTKQKGVGIFKPGFDRRANWKDLVYCEMMRWHRTPYSAWSAPTPAQMTERSKKTLHIRWHVKRGIRSESCPLCNPRHAS